MDINSSQRPRPWPSSVVQPSRQAILAQLREAIGTENVPASFWGCVQVADLRALQSLVDEASTAPRLLGFFMRNCHAIPRLWMQKPLTITESEDQSLPSVSSRSSQPSRRRGVLRSVSASDRAKNRQSKRCAITEVPQIEVCHIFPRCLLSENRSGHLRDSLPNFWDMIRMFFGNDLVREWRSVLFRDPLNPNRGSDVCENLLCFNPYIHQLWIEGAFALKPLSQTEDARAITVEWHWLPKVQHGPKDDVSLSVSPGLTEGLDQSGEAYLCTRDGRFVHTGQRFTFTTTDPITMPLPSFTLLDMQFKLNQIVSLSAAAEERGDDNSDDDERVPPVPSRDIEAWLSNNDSDTSSPDEDTTISSVGAGRPR